MDLTNVQMKKKSLMVLEGDVYLTPLSDYSFQEREKEAGEGNVIAVITQVITGTSLFHERSTA